jgi:TolA-binding protein
VPVATTRTLLALVALVAFGCGSEEKEEARLSKAQYQDELLAVLGDSDEPTTLYTDLVVEHRSPEDCAAGVAKLQDQIDALIDRVAELTPPENAQPIQDDFVAAARRSVDQIGEVQKQVAAGDVSCGMELNDELYGMPSSNEAERAIARMERAGYFVFGE